jgi:ribosome-associated translation inhibitor RaiA
MQVPLEIAFHNMEPSEFVEAKVRERVNTLERYSDRITLQCQCRGPHRAHHQGNLYHVRIEISVPGKELVVSRDPGDVHAHDDVYVAIRDAFDAAGRQLAEHERKLKAPTQ